MGGLHADDSEELERAYFENSLLFVSSTHNSWTNPKIVKRIMRGGKWGNLRKSTRATVVEMMEAHKQDVLAWVKDQSFDETVEEPVHMSL